MYNYNEPWTAETDTAILYDTIWDSSRNIITIDGVSRGKKANYDRIVRCVNACANIPDVVLDAIQISRKEYTKASGQVFKTIRYIDHRSQINSTQINDDYIIFDDTPDTPYKITHQYEAMCLECKYMPVDKNYRCIPCAGCSDSAQHCLFAAKEL